MALTIFTTCTKDVDVTSDNLPNISGYPIVGTNQSDSYSDSISISMPISGQDYYGQNSNYPGNTPTYTDNVDGTVTDKVTGLMWAQSDGGVKMDWIHALYFAENSTLAGYADKRLPNVKELQSIVDYSYSPTAIDASKVGTAINKMFSCTPIINEAGNSDYGYYWTSTSAHFTSGTPYYNACYVAFGCAVDGTGADFHGAGAVRFDTKEESVPLGEGGERYYNFVRLVRNVKTL